MLVTIDRAAQIFAVPAGHLLRLMASKLKRATTDEIIVEFLDVAKELRCPDEVTAKVLMGVEWLMGGLEIERLYGYDEVERRRIAVAPVFTPRPYDAVWRVTPFLEFQRKPPAWQTRTLRGTRSWQHSRPQK